MFYTWGMSGCPHICMPIYIHTPPCLYALRVYMPPYTPILFYASVFLEAFHVVGGCNELPFVLGHPPLHHPCLGVPPLYYTPTLSHWFPVHQYVSGISACYLGISLLSGRVWGCFPHQLGVGASALRCPYADSFTFFVVHYVSHFDYGSNYYSLLSCLPCHQ